MKLEEILKLRSENKCELCKAETNTTLYEVPFAKYKDEHGCAMICSTCSAQIEKKEMLNYQHWNCLTEAMWSEVPAIQVISWRMLNRLRDESWAADNLDMMFLDDDTLVWAKATGDHENSSEVDLHRDANGQQLQDGDITMAHLGIWSRKDPWAPAVLEQLIVNLKARGFCFATLPKQDK